MSAINSQDIDGLLSWVKKNGSSLHASVEIYSDEITGLSFRATEAILERSNLVDCSYKTTISWLNAIDADKTFARRTICAFPTEFLDLLSEDNPNVISHFFLIQQYLLKENSFWWSYIKLLPQPNELSVPILWPKEDQMFLNGTNAEPAIKKRRQLWQFEWAHGIRLLKDSHMNSDQYTFELYQWAAAIFGSRSFRPSLTISPQLFDAQKHSPEEFKLIRDHISSDTFSILLPVLDIGNHNGKNEVDWSRGSTSFSLLNKSQILAGSQIYNYYGDKPNSELLVAYGFMLPETDKNRVNLKLIPPLEIQQLRRSQASHVLPNKNHSDQEFMFNFGINEKKKDTLLMFFSDGLFDTTICMLLNTRERRWVSENPSYSAESDADFFHGPLARSAFGAMGVLKTKLQLELERLAHSHPGKPQNSNQSQSITYRTRQTSLLTLALSNIASYPSQANPITLTTAFAWLSTKYEKISIGAESAIAQDQEESTPISWDVLVPDWDHAYLILFVYIILYLSNKSKGEVEMKHPKLFRWVEAVRKGGKENEFWGESDERETIDFTIDSVFGSDCVHVRQESGLRNLASWIVKEEALRGIPSEGGIEQDILCVQLD